MNPIWNIAASDNVTYSALQSECDVDVGIIGGGATGLAAAVKLLEAGQRVAVLEALRVGEGATGHSTGNLYGTVSSGLANIRDTHGEDTLRRVVALRMQAVSFVEKTARRYAIDCQFTRGPMYLCVRHLNTQLERKLEAEYQAAKTAGLEATLVDEVPDLPFPVQRALRLENQAQYNPRSFAVGLAKAIQAGGGSIYENSRVVDVDAKEGTVITGAGQVNARDIVHATHTPKGVNLLQAEMEPYREYGISVRLAAQRYPQGAFWVLDDSQSIRSYRYGDQQYLIIVGEKHKTGEGDLGEGYYQNLEDYARKNFNVAEISHRWSAQQYKPADQLPYIGTSAHDNVYVGTGYAADGLTWGVVAADLISQKILGQEDEDTSALFNPKRFTPLKSAKNWAEENASVAKNLASSLLPAGSRPQVEHIAPGNGEIVGIDGEKVAAYRSATGEVTLLSATCPHMKCVVKWNGADTTWDCPCHGSRFTVEGDPIEGPAYEGLQRKTPRE